MGRSCSFVVSFLFLALVVGCGEKGKPGAPVAASTGDPAKKSDPPADLPAQARVIAQDPEAAVKQFDELKKQLPKITEGDLTKTQELFNSVKGKLELARMYGPNEAKVTVVNGTDLRCKWLRGLGFRKAPKVRHWSAELSALQELQPAAKGVILPQVALGAERGP